MHKYPAVHGNPKTEDRKFIIDAILKLVLIILLSGQKRLKTEMGKKKASYQSHSFCY